MTSTTISRPLTFTELLQVRRQIAAADTGLGADAIAVVTIFDIVNPEWKNERPFRPGSIAIPTPQATRIMSWADSAYANKNARLGGLLDIWVNKGPATYDPTPA